ncbi:replicative DNA helicase [Acinetobacter guillouiae]|uniref:replicative DNA helicase n=1 Tax=Acinetobacter guillouiae TaxID=106649 RepID=UPI003AF9A398
MSDLHNIAMEQCVLMSLMTVKDSLEIVINDLSVESFFAERHKLIFQSIIELSNENKPYDVLLVEQKLNEKKCIQTAGGSEYLMQIMGESASSFYNLETYVSQLNKFKSHREIEAIGRKYLSLAQDLTLTDVFSEAESLLTQSDTQEQNNQGISFEDAIENAMIQMYQKAQDRDKKISTGVRFNLPHLDNLIGTIRNGHLCVVGGRPGSGKSTLAQMLTLDTAFIGKKGVLFVSAEMDDETLSNRMISALGLIPYSNIHNAELYNGLLEQFANTKEAYKKLPIWIEPKQKPSISEVRSYARKAKRKFKNIGLGCIVVDYLQLIWDPSKKDRTQEVASISRELKAMAKEFNCPVIALVQLNRDSEKNSRPKPSDIKESGQIEQDADQIIFVNPVLVKEDQMPTGVTELIVAKNRHGKKGIVRVRDELDVCRFRGITENEVVEESNILKIDKSSKFKSGIAGI